MTPKEFYLQASQELSTSKVDPALWAKASSEAYGDENRTHAIYIKLRAEELNILGKQARYGSAKKATLQATKTTVSGAISASKKGLSIGGKILFFLFLLLIMAIVSGVIKDLMNPNRRSIEADSTSSTSRCLEGTEYNQNTGLCDLVDTRPIAAPEVISPPPARTMTYDDLPLDEKAIVGTACSSFEMSGNLAEWQACVHQQASQATQASSNAAENAQLDALDAAAEAAEAAADAAVAAAAKVHR